MLKSGYTWSDATERCCCKIERTKTLPDDNTKLLLLLLLCFHLLWQLFSFSYKVQSTCECVKSNPSRQSIESTLLPRHAQHSLLLLLSSRSIDYLPDNYKIINANPRLSALQYKSWQRLMKLKNSSVGIELITRSLNWFQYWKRPKLIPVYFQREMKGVEHSYIMQPWKDPLNSVEWSMTRTTLSWKHKTEMDIYLCIVEATLA